jgi:hypothetical protein
MRGVLSRGVEVSGIGARPLVRVYSPRQMRRLLLGAGFSSAHTSKRHFHTSDTFVTETLARHSSLLNRPDVLERIGRLAGWYIVATATRAAATP